MINPERAWIEDDSMIVGFVSLVIAFTRYQEPDIAPGIIYITLLARNQVDVTVGNRLPSNFARIHANEE
jgi:hypothetical protein